MEESKKTLQEYLDFNYSELDLSTLELANAKRLVMCIKPSLKKLNSLERKYNNAKREYEEEQAFQESILDTYTTGLDKLIEKGTVITATLPAEEESTVETVPEGTTVINAPTGTTTTILSGQANPVDVAPFPEDASEKQESSNNYTAGTDPIGDILNPFSS